MESRKIFIAVCILATLGSRAFAFCFAPQLRVSDEYYASELVLSAVVTESRDIWSTSDPDYRLGTYYRVRVNTTYRGHRYRSLNVYSENSTARFPMKIGAPYLLFLSKDIYQNRFVDNCGNSGEVSPNSRAMQELKELPLRQSFIYGEVYIWQDPGRCPAMQLSVHSKQINAFSEVKADCTFEVDVPPGRYEADLRRDGVPVAPNGLNYKDAYCFVVPPGGSAGLAFRLADGADELNRKQILKDARHARSLCAKHRNPQFLF